MMGYYMDNRIYPKHTVVTLFEIANRGRQRRRGFYLENCIGTGAGCVAYQAVEESGIPVRLKQFRPVGMERDSELYRRSEERFLRAYDQQLEMMRDEKTSAVTAGLSGLFRDEDGWYWTSVNSMAGRTLDTLLPENSLHKNVEILSRLAESVQAYHEAGWLLLDVKPTNVLVIDSLGLRGINFFDFDSFVRVRDVQDALREHREILLSSSEAYSAPELQENTVDLEEIGPGADFYSLGAILFEALFGRAPELFDCIPDSDYAWDTVRTAEGRELTAAARAQIRAFLRRTLTLSPEGRFNTDAQLQAALEQILRQTQTHGPDLIRRLPAAVRDFYGRERECGELCRMLRESNEPICLCGMAGAGKTQLALRAAEECAGEYDCCFASFRGSIRKTLLSLPFEGLEKEKAGEDGVMVPKTEEELWQEILPALRRMDRSSLLIIDNFDAARDEDTPSLRYDPDLAELEALPIRLLYTTRCRFDGVRELCIENLESESAHRMLRAAMPEEPEEDLERLAEAVGRHTLTLRVLADTARESRGRLRARRLLETLAGAQASAAEDPISTRLRSVFRAADMSKTACSVLACAALFPRGGLCSGLLLRLFSREQWAAAGQLERCGWLRFDPVSSLWTIHPIVRLICRSEGKTRADWENVGSFAEALRKMYRSGSFEQAAADEKAQLEELFSALGKLDLRKRPKRALIAGIAAALMAMLALGLWSFRKTKESPLAQLTLTPPSHAAEETRQHDSEIVLERLRNLGARDAAEDEETGVITASLRASSFKGAGDMYVAAGALSAYPGRLYAVGIAGWDYTCLEIGRENILDAHMEYGSVPGLSRQERRDFGLGEATEYAWISLTVDAETQEKILALAAASDAMIFETDVDPAFIGLTGHASFGAVPGEGENCWYLLDGAWDRKNLCSAFAALFESDALEAEYGFTLHMEPAAAWQDPETMPPEILGANQCGIDALSGDLAFLYYRPSHSGDTISDAVFQDILGSFRDRLDCFGLPYALGSGFYREREIAVCISPERLNRELAVGTLPADRLLISSSAGTKEETVIDTEDFSWNELQAEVVETEDGCFGLRVSAPDSEYLRWQLRTAGEELIKAGGGTLYLCHGNSWHHALAADMKAPSDEAHPAADGSADGATVLFTSSPLYGIERFRESEKFLLCLYAELINTGSQLTPDSSLAYVLAQHASCLTDGAHFGLGPAQPYVS